MSLREHTMQIVDALESFGKCHDSEFPVTSKACMEAVAELRAIVKLMDQFEEFCVLYDPECTLPILAQRVFDNIGEALNKDSRA